MNVGNRLILSGMQVLIENKFVDNQAVIVEDGVITAIIPEAMIKHHMPARQIEYPRDHYLLPGMIDLHIHGANGKDVMDADLDAFAVIARALAAEGVTSFLATTMTASTAHIDAVMQVLPAATQLQEGARVLGVHLEGPFIAKEKVGAQENAHICAPDIRMIKQWQTLANNTIKLMTLAPELVGAIEFIKNIRELDIIAAIGHTNATFAEANAAIDAGCRYATHLFNAMRGIHQREPGAVSALLISDLVSAELIVDGFHLHPGIVKLAYQVKGKERLLLVSDALRAKCLGDGVYELGGQQVNVQKGKATLPDGTLAGSTLRLPQALKNMMKYTDCKLEDAVRMASANPAHVLGLSDRKGSITVGKDADLVITNKALDVVVTLRAGREIFKK